ncbi:DUF6682 family protein [Sediminimonas sp.]|uniref:phage adaptor protein n=1 Tax=Sediminimonas sp. TaxID=2823379 RepID=UPI0025E93259|nr:DUF6682 family protein [Sediminimonas sp.]
MALTAKDVLSRARVVLQDAGSTRWLLPELLDWLNDGLRSVALYKPSAISETKVLELAEGTYQELAEGQQLLRATRNITSLVAATPRVGGPVITPIAREILDAQQPNWHDTTAVPFSATVRHIMSDIMDPRIFYVYPGNDGTGKIEATVSREPTTIAVEGGDDVNDIASYNIALPISPIYMDPLLDFILYRAFSKDMQMAGSAQRSVAHYQNFMNALNLRQQIEAGANVNTTQSQPDS